VAALLKFWPLVALLMQLFTVWVCWSLRQLAMSEVKKIVDAAFSSLNAKDTEISDEVDEHGKKIIRVEGRLDGLEKTVAQLPTKADLARVEGEIRSVAGTAEATKAGVDRLEGYFLHRGVERA
jgi:hypothetical protein